MLSRGIEVPRLSLPLPPIHSEKNHVQGFSWGTGILDDSYDSMAGSLDDTGSDVDSNGASDVNQLAPTCMPGSLPGIPCSGDPQLSTDEMKARIQSNVSEVRRALQEVEDLRSELMDAKKEILQMDAETEAERGESKELQREVHELQARCDRAKHIT